MKSNHVQHISFTQSRLTDAVSVILSELLSYEHPSKRGRFFAGSDNLPQYSSVETNKYVVNKLIAFGQLYSFFLSGVLFELLLEIAV